MKESRFENLPDLSFVDLCEKEYGINRGVYNVVDRWFYDRGLTDIAERRRTILRFLHKLGTGCEKHVDGRPKFGKNGLSRKLQHFMEQQTDSTGTAR